MIEEDEDEKKEGEAPPADDNKAEAEPEAQEAEKKRDPLNTFVLAFWNPRHKDFEEKMKQFLDMANPDTIKTLRCQGEEPITE